jgi:alginate O-acetyltransferase complex protein AlgJ
VSLRELPPGQKPTPERWARVRFVPLIALLVLALVSAVMGAVVLNREAVHSAGPSATASAGAKSDLLPSQCHLPVPAPASEPWSGSNDAKARAEQTWSDHSSELTTPYVAEKDGWYDWGDIQAANFSQAVGKRYLSADEEARWHSYLSNVRDGLAKLKIPLYIVITPAKWDVYPDVLPDWAQQIRGSNSLDRLISNYPDLPIIDIRNPLRAASASSQTFSKTNSHWTDYGAWVGWKAISGCIAASDPSLSGLSASPSDGVQISADHNEFAPFGISDPPANWTSPEYSSPLSDVVVSMQDGTSSTVSGATPTDLLSLPASTTTANAQVQSSALVVRDSFGNALSVPIQQSFARTWQVRHNFDGKADSQPDIVALARTHRPNVVILQIAERHLNFVPAL